MSYHFVATTSRGLETVLAQELRSMGIGVDATGRGVVYFVGKLESGYRACLWSRIASRVFLRLARGRVDSPDAVYALANSVDWSEHLGADQTLLVDFVGQGRGISNSVFGAQRIKDAIVDDLREETDAGPMRILKTRPARQCPSQKGSLTLSLDLRARRCTSAKVSLVGQGASKRESGGSDFVWRNGQDSQQKVRLFSINVRLRQFLERRAWYRSRSGSWSRPSEVGVYALERARSAALGAFAKRGAAAFERAKTVRLYGRDTDTSA